MGRVVNVMKVIKKTKGTINTLYDASYQNIIDIMDNNKSEIDMVCDAFTFGYAQGLKAAKTELKKV